MLNTMFSVFEGKVVKSFTVDNNNVYFNTDSNGIIVYSDWTCCAESRAEVVSFTSGYVEEVEVTNVDFNNEVNGFDSNKGVYSVFLRSGDTTLVEMKVYVETGKCSYDEDDYVDVNVVCFT